MCSLIEFNKKFGTEKKCVEDLTKSRWGLSGRYCPHCASNRKIYAYKDGKRYKCADCRKVFSLRVGTIFHDSKLPLTTWYLAMFLYARKKSVSSHQLATDLGITQKSAFHLLHRIRQVAGNDGYEVIPLKVEVEIDETYIGGNELNKHTGKRTKGTQGRSRKTKVIAFGMHERGGNTRAVIVENVRAKTIMPHIVNNTALGASINADDCSSYKSIGKVYDTGVVNHSAGEYVKGKTHTNGIENFWSHLKRNITGTYHHVSRKHLQRYLDEFCFRSNHRNVKSLERFGNLVSQIDGTRLTYRGLLK